MTCTRRNLFGKLGGLLSAAMVARLAAPATARAYPRKVAFEDTSPFDDVLSKSMDEGFEAIDVGLPQTAGKRMPARLRGWVARVQSTGGEVRFRDVTPKSRGIWILLAEVIVGLVGPYAVEAVRAVMRDPASDYHAVIVGQGVSPETAEILGVEFYRRGSSSWAEAIEISKPMKLKP